VGHRQSCPLSGAFPIPYKCTIKLLKPGGIFYLDNSDRGIKSKDAETRLAEGTILRFAEERHAEVFHFTDFAPTQFFVQQGLMSMR
jgi:hypothetical protein